MAETNELVVVIDQSGVEQQTANTLKESFLPFFEQAEEWRRKAEAIRVTDASQVLEMQSARFARLRLREIRINADKTRKALKEDSLRYGKAVQGVYNVIEYLIAPIEEHLEKQERFVEIQKAEQEARLKAAREMELAPYAEFVPPVFLGLMPEDEYQTLLQQVKGQMAQKIEMEQKAEADRIERERKEAEEREKMRVENERLKKEAEEREKAMQQERAKAEAERKAAEAKLQAEIAARQKIEAEARAKAEAERKAAEAAKSAPDKEKLLAFAGTIDTIVCQEVAGDKAAKIVSDSMQLLAKVSAFIREKTAEI